MKRDVLHAASTLLTPDEQRMLLRLGEMTWEEGPVVAFDMDIRTGMCTALADLGGAVNALLSLLNTNHIAETLSPEAQTAYASLMERIAAAAVQATEMVERSRNFDEDALVAISPEASRVRQ